MDNEPVFAEFAQILNDDLASRGMPAVYTKEDAERLIDAYCEIVIAEMRRKVNIHDR